MMPGEGVASKPWCTLPQWNICTVGRARLSVSSLLFGWCRRGGRAVGGVVRRLEGRRDTAHPGRCPPGPDCPWAGWGPFPPAPAAAGSPAAAPVGGRGKGKTKYGGGFDGICSVLQKKRGQKARKRARERNTKKKRCGAFLNERAVTPGTPEPGVGAPCRALTAPSWAVA